MHDYVQLFDEALRHEDDLLGRALKYVGSRKGKMMRPILVLLVAKELSPIVGEASLRSAVTLELLHTASLVHDDVVDESDERRGQSSVNAVYNNKVSVLVGDYMLATSLKHAAHTGILKLVDLVSRLGQELSEGEIIQLANVSNQNFSEEVYFDVIRKKTAALFTASAESGAVSVYAGEAEEKNAALFGEMIGIAFQIKDDIFDYYDSPALGKPTGNDMMEGKLTLPALYVINRTQEQPLRELALRIRSMKASKEEIAAFVERVKEEGGIAYAEKVMHSYRDKALELLPATANEAIRASLTAYIDYVIEREK